MIMFLADVLTPSNNVDVHINLEKRESGLLNSDSSNILIPSGN